MKKKYVCPLTVLLETQLSQDVLLVNSHIGNGIQLAPKEFNEMILLEDELEEEETDDDGFLGE